ncbi:MAG TPA: hypothetical protein VIL74_20700 [Pyrinomonadaceae bacterium]|jgi:hypothetical protein
MKTVFHKGLILWAIVVALVMASQIFSAPKGSAKTPRKAVAAKSIVAAKNAGIFDAIAALLKALTFQKSGYRAVEKNVFVNMPEKMPKEWLTPKKAKVHSLGKPSALELQIVDEKISKQIANFEKPFDRFAPADFGKKAKKFKKHSEYRFWLLDDEGRGRIAPAISESIKGCPLVATSASSTGYASGVTGGFEVTSRGVKAIYPFIVVPRLSPAQLADPRCREHWETTLENEIDHFLASNSRNLFTQPDVHPFDW